MCHDMTILANMAGRLGANTFCLPLGAGQNAGIAVRPTTYRSSSSTALAGFQDVAIWRHLFGKQTLTAVQQDWWCNEVAAEP
jgi:hypothetical protein